MADPLSVAGSVVGIISLAIQVTQGLVDYYKAANDQHSDVAHTTKKLANLLTILDCLQQQVDNRKFRADEKDLLRSIESSVEQCEECIEELKDEADKFKPNTTDGIRAAGRAAARRVAYPFRQSTLQKLDEDIDDIVRLLSVSLQLLQQGDIGRVQDDIEDAKAVLNLVRTSQISFDIRGWLKAPDAGINFNESCQKKHPSTGLWFVNGAAFLNWLQAPKSFLWLNGFAGCGKSVLCSTAIQHTLRHRRSNPQIGMAFFFFTFSDVGKQDASAMLRALVIQLSGQLDSNHTILSKLYNSYRNAMPPDQALLDCLHQLVREFQDVYILLDALDESPRDKHREDMLQVLYDMRAWSEPGLHLLVTSRDEVDIRNELDAKLEETVAMRNDSIDGDISSFISQHLRQNRRLRKWEDQHSRIETAFTQRAKGVFRWVECQFKALISCPQSEDLLDKLLDSLPHTLDATYERMLGNIPLSSRSYAQQMLTLLCCARRPLTLRELIDGIAFELGETPRFNAKRRLKNIDAVQEVCPGFIELYEDDENESTTMHIAHFSVQEYLESDRIREHKEAALFSVQRQDAHGQIASTCLTLLLEPVLLQFKNPEKIQDSYPFAEYAAQYWPEHFEDSDGNAHLKDQVVQLFRNPEGPFRTWVGIYNIDGFSEPPEVGEIPPPLYYAALLSLDFIVHMLLSENPTSDGSRDDISALSPLLNAEYGYYGTALQAASSRGSQDIVQLLIEKGADVNAEGGRFGYALQGAATRFDGHAGIIQLLLDKGADINAQGGLYANALQAAAYYGNEGIMQLLLDRGADVHAQGGQYGNVLQAAVAGRHDETVQLLLNKGVDPNVQCGWYGNALQAASANGNQDTVQLLLDKGADVNVQGGLFGNALQAAAYGFDGDYGIVRLLLEKGADVNAQGGRFGNALQAAAYGFGGDDGNEGIIELLLEKGANVNAQGGLYDNALQAALYVQNDGVVKLLQERGAKRFIHHVSSSNTPPPT